MTSELKAAAIVAIHGNDDAAFVELAPKVAKPMSDDELRREAEKVAVFTWQIDRIVDIAKRYAASQRGV